MGRQPAPEHRNWILMNPPPLYSLSCLEKIPYWLYIVQKLTDFWRVNFWILPTLESKNTGPRPPKNFFFSNFYFWPKMHLFGFMLNKFGKMPLMKVVVCCREHMLTSPKKISFWEMTSMENRWIRIPDVNTYSWVSEVYKNITLGIQRKLWKWSDILVGFDIGYKNNNK